VFFYGESDTMLYKDKRDLEADCSKALSWTDTSVTLQDAEDFRSHRLDRLVYNAVFHPEPRVRNSARWMIRSAALAFGAVPSSIQTLYEAAGKGLYSNRTVPAINIRGITYDVARAVFRAARTTDTGALIFEIARSEMSYTSQSPEEYASCVLAAAIREGFQGPVFLQGDHFQFNLKKYKADPDKETAALRDLTAEAIRAGFYNIDIDASTLVELHLPSVREQQLLNSRVTAEMTRYVRTLEPEGITISVGGEIGEVGKHNSTVEELRAFMDQYLQMLGGSVKGISKISVQTGTTHGGIPLPDGTVAEVKLDFHTLQELSRTARESYGLGGAVQHGASTLPDEAFDRFPAVGTLEVHLATGFQNMIYESPAFPEELRREIYTYLAMHHAEERKQGQTEEQFIYSVRKRGFGPFKKHMWDMPRENLERIAEALEEKMAFLFVKLGVAQSTGLVAAHVRPVKVAIPRPL